MKWLIGALVVLLLVLQYRLWFGEGSVQQFMALRQESRETHNELQRLRGRNQALEAEVADLKSGLDAIEERARTELGMIDENETFYQFVKKREADRAANSDVNTISSEQLGGRTTTDPADVTQGPIDEDGSAIGRPVGPDGEALAPPDAELQTGN